MQIQNLLSSLKFGFKEISDGATSITATNWTFACNICMHIFEYSTALCIPVPNYMYGCLNHSLHICTHPHFPSHIHTDMYSPPAAITCQQAINGLKAHSLVKVKSIHLFSS